MIDGGPTLGTITHQDLISVSAWLDSMAEEGNIADFIEKPWKCENEILFFRQEHITEIDDLKGHLEPGNPEACACCGELRYDERPDNHKGEFINDEGRRSEFLRTGYRIPVDCRCDEWHVSERVNR